MTAKFQQDISKFSRPLFDVSRGISAMLETPRIDDLIEQYTLKRLEIEESAKRFSSISNGWKSQLALADLDKWSLKLQSHLAMVYERTSIAEATLAGVKPEHFGTRLEMKAEDRAELASRHEELGAEYRNFHTELKKSEFAVLDLPAELTELPAGEVVNEAALVASTSETEVDEGAAQAQSELTTAMAAETTDILTDLVAHLDPELIHLLNGAREAFASRHTDYVRHFVTSYRELFTHVLHKLSPDDEVKVWSKDPEHYHNGTPTRRSRLSFITRELSLGFGGFLNADVASVLEFISVFHKGTHGIKPNFTDEQLLDLKNRTEGLLRLLLTVRQITNR